MDNEVTTDSGIADKNDSVAETGGGIADGQTQDSGSETGIADSAAKENHETQQDVGAQKQEPEAYELTAPEDFPLPAENLTSFTAKARELGLTKEQAKGMLEWHKDFHTSVTGAMRQQESETLKSWAKEIQEDRDFGGNHWKATVAEARKALDAFDTDGGLRALLRDSQYQHNPTIIRAIARVGRAMGEHAFVGQNGEGKGRDIPLEERMYPDMKI